MTSWLHNITAFADRNIGRCPRCMKIAFLAASAGWLLHVLWQMVHPADLGHALLAIPVALTSLWLAHVASYACRTFGLLHAEYRAVPVPARAVERRRALLWVLGTAASITAAATVWLPSSVLAAGHPCGAGKNCPDDAPNCCSRSQGKCCKGNWACTANGKCYDRHEDARAACGSSTVWACS